jgi:predicted HNH restriction endonuclease
MEQSSIQEKVCPLCKKTKPLDSFYARKNGNAVGYCCDCVSKSRAERNKTWKNDIVAYMGGKCHFCGYNKCAAALELHHKHDKSFGISKKRLGIYDMVDELKKCILICANCHRELHYQNE